jgi:hypothetical protein
MKKFICILLVVFCAIAYAAVDLTEINHSTVTAGNFDQKLRGWVGTLNQDITRATGMNGVLSGGTIYYVDGNKSSAGNGTSWDDAYNTLSAAMAASHANIAVTSRRAWATRNTIYVRADEITEDLTTMAQKTDIIGVGSNDGYSKAGITGTWIIPDTVSYLGCRFFNMMFTDDGAGGALFDLDTQGGIEFHNCLFDGGSTDTIAIQAEESSWLVINNCEFSDVSATLPWSASAIKIVDDTNPIYGCKISNNIIMTAGIGIDWDETASYNCWISGNFVRATGLTIDEEGDNVFVVNNRLITDVDTTTSTAGYDFNIQLSCGNIQMGATGLGDTIPFAKIAE